MELLMDELTLIYKIQKRIQDSLQQLGDTMMSGIDNMEKYKYLLGQAHALQLVLQDISNLLNPKEDKKNEQRDNVVQFGSTED